MKSNSVFAFASDETHIPVVSRKNVHIFFIFLNNSVKN